MGWIFKEMLTKYENPFEAGVLKVNSTPVRTTRDQPENLIKWDSSTFYADAMKNASFEFDFINHIYVFTKYIFKGINRSCSPYKWVVEGSMDHVNYRTMHVVDRALCNISVFSSFCYEVFRMSHVIKAKYVKVVNTGGECFGGCPYFGLTSADFFGSVVVPSIPNMNLLRVQFMYMIIIIIIS